MIETHKPKSQALGDVPDVVVVVLVLLYFIFSSLAKLLINYNYFIGFFY